MVGGEWAVDLGFLTLVLGLINVSVSFVPWPISPAPRPHPPHWTDSIFSHHGKAVQEPAVDTQLLVTGGPQICPRD